jgi:hypothetical protein
MRIADLVVVRQRDTQDIGVFTSPQALVVFPIATSLIATLARGARTIGHMESDSTLVPLLTACAFGALIFITTVSDTRARPRRISGWLLALVIAAVNSLLLFVSALGIEKF